MFPGLVQFYFPLLLPSNHFGSEQELRQPGTEIFEGLFKMLQQGKVAPSDIAPHIM